LGITRFELASPARLGWWWVDTRSGGPDATLFVIRTALEDKTSLVELDGYTAYAERTRYRLLPSMW